MTSLAKKTHLLTVSLEDYFQVGAFRDLIPRGHWYRFESRFEHNTQEVLKLFDRFGAKATFYVLGWVADRYPEVVKAVADRGHEIASSGYHSRSIRQMDQTEFREELAQSREAIERASRRKVLGFRVARSWFRRDDLWALDVLADEGYDHDSSICPLFRRFAHEPWRRTIHRHESSRGCIREFPITATNLLGWDIPVAGGNYLRQLPQWFSRNALARWDRQEQLPFVMYFHAWELDHQQPKIEAISPLTRIRHYRNLEKMSSILEGYLHTYKFQSIAEYLGLTMAPATPPEDRSPELIPPQDQAGIPAGQAALMASPRSSARTPVSIVIPCYNEELVLRYLANTLQSVRTTLGRDYDVRLIFVDDGSIDATWTELGRVFADWPRTTILRHDQNRGVAAAILTGIHAADTEIVCSADCDCTYDPHKLAEMIPLLVRGVDLVTASPYHPLGKVRNVHPARLLLSKVASSLYRCVLHQKLYTYTSCFRVYRRSSIINLEVEQPGFLGVAELIGKLDLKGGKVVEYPATLGIRTLGQSKMKTFATIFAHLGLLSRLLLLRLQGRESRESERSPVPDPAFLPPRIETSQSHRSR